MKRAKELLPLKDWITIGRTCKQLRKTIMDLQCNPDIQQRMTKKEPGGLYKMGVGLADFTNYAEDAMYREYRELCGSDKQRKLLDIFYGSDEDFNILLEQS